MNAHIINHDKTPPPDFGLLPLTLKRSGYDFIYFDNSSNTDGSSTIANSCSFVSPNESLPSAQKKKKKKKKKKKNRYLGKLIMYAVCLSSTLNIPLLSRSSKKLPFAT